MESKDPSSFKESLDETEMERLSFMVYKRAMSLIGDTGKVLGLGLILFAFFGFGKWKDLSASLEDLEARTTAAESRADSAQKKLAEIQAVFDASQELFKSATDDARIETGRMRQVGEEAADLEVRITKQEEAALRRIEEIQKENGRSLDDNLKGLRAEMENSRKSRDDVERNSKEFQEHIERASSDLRDRVDRSRYAGFTVMVIQDKHSTSISANGSDIKIALGNARSDRVDDVVIDFGGEFPENRSFLKPNDAIRFTRLDTDGKMREYSFRIRDINMLAFRDLVTCDLSWDLAAAGQVARSGG